MNEQLTKTGQRLLALTAALALAMPLTASAATEAMTANVTGTLAAADESRGGCAVELTANPSDAGLDCPDTNWVTFDCTGDSKPSAMRMFDSAQLAFVAEHRVRIWVTDESKADTFCVVTRIDVLAN